METAPGSGEPEGGGVAVLTAPHNFIGCPSFRRNAYGPGLAIADARFGANIGDLTCPESQSTELAKSLAGQIF